MTDTYQTIAATGQAETRVKGSRFLAEALPVEDAAEAEAAIEAVRRREHAATHHCSAYRVGTDIPTARYNDDGEPSGTAGLPILRHLEGRHLTQVLVVVTRYYGGTKLGTGGLIRAYGDAAALALDACPVVVRTLRTLLSVRFAYDDTSPAMHTLSRFDALVEESRYGAATELVVAVRRSQAEAFAAAFVEALSGRGRVAVVTP